jgi:SAM-dependent methyltransferase
MKKVALTILQGISFVWRLIPSLTRRHLITGLFVLDSRDPDPAMGLRQLLVLRDRIDWVINERAMSYGHGEHPKHRLTNYHAFFVERISNGQNVLDVGCGYGAVGRSIARAYPLTKVIGIDIDKVRLSQARASDNPRNLTFIEADSTKSIPTGPWNVVVLSNVLEHIADRIHFLRTLQASTQSSRYLIRVPLFERDWQMGLRRELGIDFRSDKDHKIEHTLSEFRAEISESGLEIDEAQTLWGEIWADCRPL